jgi:hypothetical protein
MFTIDRKSSSKREKKSTPKSTHDTLKMLKQNHIVRDINEIKSIDLEQFLAKAPNPVKKILEEQKPDEPKERRLSEIATELKKLTDRLQFHIQNLDLEESDLSMITFVAYVRKKGLKLSSNKLFDRFLYNILQLSNLSNSKEHELVKNVTFTNGLSNIVLYISEEIDPESLYDLKLSVFQYINFAANKKLKDKDLVIKKQVELKETNKNLLIEINNTIESTKLESKISVEELILFIQEGKYISNPTVLHHLLSQMDFIRKNLHKRSGRVKFMNQAMFLANSLSKTADKNNIILGIQKYIEHKESESVWSEEDDNDKWTE